MVSVPHGAPSSSEACGGETVSPKSKVLESIEQKGEHSYYFAHTRPRDDLSTAQRIEGDGTRVLAALDGMRKLEETKEAVITDRKVRWREDYAWGDEGAKVKVYLEFPEGALKNPEVKVDAKFEDTSFEVVVHNAAGSPEPVGVTNGEHKLSGTIIPSKCSWRFNSAKTRLTVTLVKEDEQEGAWSTLKKHVISKATGWN